MPLSHSDARVPFRPSAKIVPIDRATVGRFVYLYRSLGFVYLVRRGARRWAELISDWLLQ